MIRAKIKEEKTRAIWIGANSNSNSKLCENFKLDWTQGPAKILRVTFTTNVYDIWDFDSIEILNSQRNVKAMVKTKTYSFPTHNHHKVTGVIKVCITVSVITESSCGAYQGSRVFLFSNSYGMQAQIE